MGSFTRAIRWAVPVVAGIVVLSCARGRVRLPSPFRSSAPEVAVATGPRIDHESHIAKGLECADCHFKDAAKGEPFDPKPITYKVCSECHDEEDAPLPDDKKVKNRFFTAAGAAKWTTAIKPYDDEILFRHGPHVKAGSASCATCHGEMKGEDRFVGLRFSMGACMSCHQQKGARNSCDACHRDIRTDARPPSHEKLWKEVHGQLARSDREKAEQHCDLCHDDQAFCDRCHRDEAPRSHNQLWRLKSHGVMAAMDRKSCQTCHQTDYCIRCHESTPPSSHRGRWGPLPSTHCTECHFPIRREESCRVCHFEEPKHETATDQPASHVPGMDCRLCHTPAGSGPGGAPRLPHFDNGTECAFCHK